MDLSLHDLWPHDLWSHDLWETLILGLVQGVTEFLPISSSGHLVICSEFLQNQNGEQQGPLLEVALHVGTLIAILLYYRRDLINAFSLVLGWKSNSQEKAETGSLLKWIVIGSVPTAALGLAFKDWFEALFDRPMLVGFALCATGLICLVTRFLPRGDLGVANLGVFRALLIGLAQGLAIIPGISRSGATIVTGLTLGMDPREAGRFSFLLSVPAVAGAAVLKFLEGGGACELLPLLIGILVSAVVGFLCLGLLTRVLKAGSFFYFGFYCVPLGLFVILYFS